MAKRDYVESSRNVFADLGHPQADEMMAKAELSQKNQALFYKNLSKNHGLNQISNMRRVKPVLCWDHVCERLDRYAVGTSRAVVTPG
jgi:hypothetical protein